VFLPLIRMYGRCGVLPVIMPSCCLSCPACHALCNTGAHCTVPRSTHKCAGSLVSPSPSAYTLTRDLMMMRGRHIDVPHDSRSAHVH